MSRRLIFSFAAIVVIVISVGFLILSRKPPSPPSITVESRFSHRHVGRYEVQGSFTDHPVTPAEIRDTWAGLAFKSVSAPASRDFELYVAGRIPTDSIFLSTEYPSVSGRLLIDVAIYEKDGTVQFEICIEEYDAERGKLTWEQELETLLGSLADSRESGKLRVRRR